MLTKEFILKKNTDYFKSYFRSILIILPSVLLGIINIYSWDFPYKKEAFLCCTFLVVIFLLLGVRKYLNEKGKRYIIGNHGIQIIKNNEIFSYEFARLKNIKRYSATRGKQAGFDTLTLNFHDGKKIKIDSRIPFYHELRIYLKEVLRRSGYYDRIAVKNGL